MSAAGQKILVVDDEQVVCNTLARLFKNEARVETVTSAQQALEALRREPAHLVLADIRMPGMSGLELLRQIKAEFPDTEVIMMTAYGSVSEAVEALRNGAYHYVTKPFEMEVLQVTVREALELSRLREETRILREQVQQRWGFGAIVGNSPAIREAIETARKAANADTTVLLVGESGTGKELFARAIHHASPRGGRRFVAVNCAAMPRELIESELFGYVRGAFTGAVRNKPGLFSEADGGTLFLDEVTELAPELQVKVNRAIQEREIRRVGDTADIPVDVRIIAATNRDPDEALRSGSLREDLYYRLQVFPIRLPPLRERLEDIPLLAEHFLNELATERGQRYELTPAALQVLTDYHWPGNVRELRNALERAVVLADGPRLGPELFAPFRRTAPQGPAAEESEDLSRLPYRQALEKITRAGQRRYLEGLLKRHGWNVSAAARAAGIRRESLYRLMRQCGITPPRGR